MVVSWGGGVLKALKATRRIPSAGTCGFHYSQVSYQQGKGYGNGSLVNTEMPPVVLLCGIRTEHAPFCCTQALSELVECVSSSPLSRLQWLEPKLCHCWMRLGIFTDKYGKCERAGLPTGAELDKQEEPNICLFFTEREIRVESHWIRFLAYLHSGDEINLTQFVRCKRELKTPCKLIFFWRFKPCHSAPNPIGHPVYAK